MQTSIQTVPACNKLTILLEGWCGLFTQAMLHNFKTNFEDVRTVFYEISSKRLKTMQPLHFCSFYQSSQHHHQTRALAFDDFMASVIKGKRLHPTHGVRLKFLFYFLEGGFLVILIAVCINVQAGGFLYDLYEKK